MSQNEKGLRKEKKKVSLELIVCIILVLLCIILVFIMCIGRNTHVCLLQALGDVGQRGDISEGGEGVIWDKVMCTEEVVVPQHFTSGSNESLLADIKVSSTLTLEVGPKPMDGNFSKGKEWF